MVVIQITPNLVMYKLRPHQEIFVDSVLEKLNYNNKILGQALVVSAKLYACLFLLKNQNTKL